MFFRNKNRDAYSLNIEKKSLTPNESIIVQKELESKTEMLNSNHS